MIKTWFTIYGGKIVLFDRVLEMPITAELGYNLIKKAFKSALITKEEM
jgi:hypothetical protein